MQRTRAVGRRDAISPLALAIDIGTSSTRAAVFDALARPLAGAGGRTAHRVELDARGAATLDADALVANVAACIDTALARSGRRAVDIAVVATSVFWHSLLGVDRHGRAITPLYTWADLRARDVARALRSAIDPAAFHERTGCYLHSTYPVVKLPWLREVEPKRFARAARWVSFAEYLMLRLAGRAAVSHGIAAATGLYRHATRSWDPQTLSAIGVDEGALSPISDAATVGLRGGFARRWRQLAGIPWIPGMGDGALANVGSGCATPDRAALSLGTSGAVRTCYRDDRAVAPHGLWEYRLDADHVVVGGAVSNGWNAIQWGAHTWRYGNAPARDDALTVLPLFAGERTPWWDDDASAAIAGIRMATTPAQLAEALIEAVVLRLAAAAQTLIDARPSIGSLIASGGTFAWRPALAQVIADALGRPVDMAAESEASARGAAIVGLVRIGAMGSIVTEPAVARTFRPRPAMRPRYQAALERQARLHEALRAARL